jgi:hypothetical protein
MLNISPMTSNPIPKPAQPLAEAKPKTVEPKAPEAGGPKGPEPTRYGDWERNGKCVDF